MPSIRIERLQNQIKARIAMVLTRDVADPRMGLVTITRVDLAKDLAEAKVWWSTLAEGGQRTAIAHALDAATPFIQREVGAILKTRLTPKLQFRFDESLERMERLSGIIGDALAEDRENQVARGEIDPVTGEVIAIDEADDGTPADGEDGSRS